MLGGTLYLVGLESNDVDYVENANSCSMCKRMIINSGIKKVVYRNGYPDEFSKVLLEEVGVALIKFDDNLD